MNLSICKKCLNKKKLIIKKLEKIIDNKKMYYFALKSDTTLFNRITSCPCIDSITFKNNYEIEKIIKNKEEYKFMNVNEKCPYYLEHQIGAWNK